MAAITVEEVLAAARRVLGRMRERAGVREAG